MRFLHSLEATDMLEINRALCDCGGVALFGMHMFYFDMTPKARRMRAERICRQARLNRTHPVQFDPGKMADQMERYNHGLTERLKSNIPVGLMFEGVERTLPLQEAGARLQRRYEYLQQIDRSGRKWIVVPTERKSARPVHHKDWNQFVSAVYGLGVRRPVLCGCSLLTWANGEAVEPEPKHYACVNELALVLDESGIFDQVHWDPTATHTRVIPF